MVTFPHTHKHMRMHSIVVSIYLLIPSIIRQKKNGNVYFVVVDFLALSTFHIRKCWNFKDDILLLCKHQTA